MSVLKCSECLTALENEKPIYLVGTSARNFKEFESFGGTQTTEGTRTILDIDAFGTNPPYPGFISNKFEGCH